MWNERARAAAQHGFTLVEMLLAIVVLGVGIAGVMLAFSVAVRGSADPLVQHQMLAIAEEMMEEIQLKPYAPAKTASGCYRSGFAGMMDYDGYSCAIYPINAAAGDPPVAALAGYAVSVSITTPGLAGVAEARRVQVTVTRGGDSLTLVGWRTNYGG
jgi:MSHA pilin protein MshD